MNNSKQFVISKKLIFFESWKSQTPYPPLQFHSHAFEDLSSYLSEILLSLGTCFQGFHQHYSKMYPLESTEVRFQNYVTVFSRVLHVIYKWDVLLNYLLLFLYVNEWYFCSSLLIPYYLVTIKIVIYIYICQNLSKTYSWWYYSGVYRVCCFIRKKIYFALIVFVYDPFAWNDEKNCIGLVLTCVSLQSITKCDIFLKEESTIYH